MHAMRTKQIPQIQTSQTRIRVEKIIGVEHSPPLTFTAMELISAILMSCDRTTHVSRKR